jgi:anthranilate phosphoribosyltransferase
VITQAILKALDGTDLERSECAGAIAEIVDGEATPAQAGAFLVALRAKGESASEIAGAASVLRERATPITIHAPIFVDTCGTGGDGRHTFNVSTTAAIVVASCGVVVAKHGNRAVSSRCGSADVLSELGVRIDLEASAVEACIARIGIGFLLAPRLHPALGKVAPIRRELGTRTIFNLLGPLVSPALPRRQVVGVFDARLVSRVARALAELGAEHALVVHGCGLDEIAISGPTTACEITDGLVRDRTILPSDFGLEVSPADALLGGDAGHNAELVRRILGGELGPRRDAVIASASAALYVAGAASSFLDGARIAARAIDSGAAAAKLNALVSAAREEAA